MTTDVRPVRQLATQSRGAGPRPGDGGFTVIEVMVAISLVAIVMTALMTAFGTSISVTGEQSNRQTAIQLANAAMDRVSALAGPALVTGRAQADVDTQWADPDLATEVETYLVGMQRAYDATTPPPPAALPTVPEQALVNGLEFSQHWYVGRCWLPKTGGDCDDTPNTSDVELFRVVVAVTWLERRCPAGCSYVTSTLVSGHAGEPRFNTNQTGPVVPVTPLSVLPPGNQSGEVAVPASLQVQATGGEPPYLWSGTGLPPGLSINSSGLIAGTPLTAGPYTVTVTATDAAATIATQTFAWTVVALPTLTDPEPQVTVRNTEVSPALQIAHTGGTAPLSWSATGLPPGLTISATTGAITGTPTTARAASPVTVTVTDLYNKTAATTFNWAVVLPLQIVTPFFQLNGRTSNITPLVVSASGGVAPYAWSASGLPPGLEISPTTGRITGKPTDRDTYTVAVTVTDSSGQTATTDSFSWEIT